MKFRTAPLACLVAATTLAALAGCGEPELQAQDLLPFAVCNEVTPMEEPSGL